MSLGQIDQRKGFLKVSDLTTADQAHRVFKIQRVSTVLTAKNFHSDLNNNTLKYIPSLNIQI